MTVERIEIVITERGSRTVRRNIDDLGRGASRAQGAVSLLRRALLALGGTLILRQLNRLVDTFQNLQNRIRTVTQGSAELQFVTNKLFEVSNRTRSSFEGTVEVYARTALAVKELGISQQQTIRFAESLNQAIVLSGSGAQEARNALIQLSQGLASNTLRGDELRSVLEQLPVVADVIAESLGVTRGQLRLLGADGKITAGVILKAFKDARGELADRFAKVVPTVGQAFQVLRNQILKFTGELFTTTGIAREFSKAIILIANNLDTVARIVATVAIAIGQVLAVRALALARTAVLAFGAALLTPVGVLTALIAGLTLAVGALIAFQGQIKISERGITTLADVFDVLIDRVSNGFQTLVDFIGPTAQRTVDAINGILEGFDFTFSSLLRLWARFLDSVVGLVKGSIEAVGNVFDILVNRVSSGFFNVFNSVLNEIEARINRLIEIVNGLITTVNDIVAAAGGEAGAFSTINSIDLGGITPPAEDSRAIGETIGEDIANGIKNQTFVADAVEDLLADADRLAFSRLLENQDRVNRANAVEARSKSGGQAAAPGDTKAETKFKEFLRDLDRETQLLRLSNDEREIRAALFEAEDVLGRKLSESQKERVTNAIRLNQELAQERTILDEINGPAERYKAQIAAITRLYEEGRISAEKFRQTVRDVRIEFLEEQTDADSGVERFFLKFQKSSEDTASQVESLLGNAFTNAEDALVNFVKTGKLEFEDLIDSLISDLVRLFIKSQILGPIAGLLGGDGSSSGGGGLLGGLFGGGGGGGFGGGGGGILGGLFGGGGGGFGIGSFFGFANGGLVSGPGSSTSDSIPARLSNGEFVVNAAATREFMPLLSAINSGQDISVPAGGASASGAANVTLQFAIDARDAESPEAVERRVKEAVRQATPKIVNEAVGRSVGQIREENRRDPSFIR